MKKAPSPGDMRRCAAVLTCAVAGVALPASAGPRLVTGPGADPLSRLAEVHLVDISDPRSPELARFAPYPSGFTGGIRVATGDITGDGTPDIITAPGRGELGPLQPGPKVRAFDGVTLKAITNFDFHPYGPGYTGGVTVAAGDFNRDGIADIVTGTDLFGSPQFRVFDGVDQSLLGTFSNLTGFGFTGEVGVATGDVNLDGIDDIALTAGGRSVLFQTQIDNLDRVSWATPASGSFSPFGDGYTGHLSASVFTPKLAAFPAIAYTATGSHGLSLIDVSDPELPRQVGTTAPFGGTGNVNLGGGADFDGDGLTDPIVSRGSGLDVQFVGAQGSVINVVTQGLPNPYGNGTPGFVEGLDEGAPISVQGQTVQVQPDGTFHTPDFAPDLGVKITSTNGNIADPFKLHSINPAALNILTDLDGNPIELPPGVALLPFTRGLFVDVPDGVTEADYDGRFRINLSEAAKKFLEENELLFQDLRLFRLTGNPNDLQGNFTLSQFLGAPTLGPPTGAPGQWGIESPAIQDTAAYATVDGFSGYVIAYVPEPAALTLISLAGLPLLRRRRHQ